MADKSAEKERLFNEWFTASYARLRGTLRRYGMLDETISMTPTFS